MDSSFTSSTILEQPPAADSISASISTSLPAVVNQRLHSLSSPVPVTKSSASALSSINTTITNSCPADQLSNSALNSPIKSPPLVAISNSKLLSHRQSLSASLSTRGRSISYTASQTKNLISLASNALSFSDSFNAPPPLPTATVNQTRPSTSSFAPTSAFLTAPANLGRALSAKSSRSSLKADSINRVPAQSTTAPSVKQKDSSGPSIAFVSKPYSETDATRPPPIKVSRLPNAMHQTSSRLLRMTDDDRPFTRDFKDLFSTLIVSLLPLGSHRVRLTRIDYTFLSEDAINNLSSLKFSQSNRMPDPKDPSRIVTTTTTTTFSMARDMARTICQRFVEARLIESADGRYQQTYAMKGQVWQLTPKGIAILDRFCQRNGITQKQVSELIGHGPMHLVILERDTQTDKLVTGKGIIEVIFRRFIGTRGPNIKNTVSSADSDSLSDYRDGLTGVKMAAERRINGRVYKDTFTGKTCCDWLMDCATLVERKEVIDLATMFVEHNLIEVVIPDRTHIAQNPMQSLFQPTKHAIYQLTQHGKDIINGTAVRGRSSEGGNDTASVSARGGASVSNIPGRDSNTARLDKILNDAALRLLFRENLRETHCEENLSFYMDVDEFVQSCRVTIRNAAKGPLNSSQMETVKEIMAQAYGIYNAFLAPGSPCELNIDHQLRNNLATRMTKAVGKDVSMIETLQDVAALFEDAQNAVFKLMASDSVPKFLKTAKYEQTLKDYDFNFDGPASVGRPERSLSRSARG